MKRIKQCDDCKHDGYCQNQDLDMAQCCNENINQESR